jgi:hypothetical protein
VLAKRKNILQKKIIRPTLVRGDTLIEYSHIYIPKFPDIGVLCTCIYLKTVVVVQKVAKPSGMHPCLLYIFCQEFDLNYYYCILENLDELEVAT